METAAAEAAAAAATGTVSETVERRRPGRATTVNPELVALLRSQPGAGATVAPGTAASGAVEDASAEKPGLPPLALRGIAIGILFAIPIWVAVGLCIAWIVRSR
jgi:hypothetical protein